MEIASLGAEPKIHLRYQFRAGDRIAWDAEVSQRTELRTETSCPAPDAPQEFLSPPEQTIPMAYRVRVVSLVTSAPPQRFTLETAFENVRLTLPPALSEKKSEMESLVGNTSYTITMNRKGHTESFVLGKLAGAESKHLLDRLRSPLGMMHPLLPEPAIGMGATWRYVHRLSLQQPGGLVNALYASVYRLERIDGDAGTRVVTIHVHTTVNLEGKVMGENYGGQGRGDTRLELDVSTGLVRSLEGEMKICTLVMGRSSTNVTRFRQTFLPKESVKGPKPLGLAKE